jgi:membrane protease subunit HflC
LLNSALRRVLGEAIATDIVQDKRSQLMALVRGQLENEAKFFGIAVVDVRIKHANLPPQNSQAVYQRMQTERQRQAAAFRAQGSQRSLEIRAKADRDATILIAQATAASEQVRGDGDAARNRIYATAYGRDPEFFAFYRTMQAYENALPARSTSMLLTPNSDFFRYFGDPMGKLRQPKEPR